MEDDAGLSTVIPDRRCNSIRQNFRTFRADHAPNCRQALMAAGMLPGQRSRFSACRMSEPPALPFGRVLTESSTGSVDTFKACRPSSTPRNGVFPPHVAVVLSQRQASSDVHSVRTRQTGKPTLASHMGKIPPGLAAECLLLITTCPFLRFPGLTVRGGRAATHHQRDGHIVPSGSRRQG